MPRTDLPRIGISITLTQPEADRLDELCEQQGVDRERLIRMSLAAYDCQQARSPESVFLRPEEQ